MLDVEEGGPGKRSITSLDSATSITTNTTCFMSSDGKEGCYIDALPGECDVVNSFASDGRRHLSFSASDIKDVIGNFGGGTAFTNARSNAPTNAPTTNTPTIQKGTAQAKKPTKNM